MPPDAVWTQPQPLLVMAAIALRQGAHEAAAAQLAAAEDILGHPEADDQIPARLAAALIQLELARRTGDLEMAATAARRAEDVMTELPEEVRARHPEVQTQVIADCGVVETWAGRLDAAAVRLADAAAVPATETAHERAGCLGYLALVEALQRTAEPRRRAGRGGGRGTEQRWRPHRGRHPGGQRRAGLGVPAAR